MAVIRSASRERRSRWRRVAIDDFREADGQAVQLGKAGRNGTAARFALNQAIEVASAQRGHIFGQLVVRGKVVKRAVDVGAELRPMRRAGNQHRIAAAQVLGNAEGHGAVRVKQIPIAVVDVL